MVNPLSTQGVYRIDTLGYIRTTQGDIKTLIEDVLQKGEEKR